MANGRSRAGGSMSATRPAFAVNGRFARIRLPGESGQAAALLDRTTGDGHPRASSHLQACFVCELTVHGN